MKKLLILISFIFVCGCDDLKLTENKKNYPPRFELHKTKNVFTSLLLDSRTGRLWQVQFSLDGKNEGAIPLSTVIRANRDEDNGRFSLTSTPNLWTFLMTDTVTGEMWHCQFSFNNKSFRGCYSFVEPIESKN